MGNDEGSLKPLRQPFRHLHGPDRPLTFAGAQVDDLIPVALGDAGNATVSFDALSYAGTLSITVVADPDHVPDLPLLAAALQAEVRCRRRHRIGHDRPVRVTGAGAARPVTPRGASSAAEVVMIGQPTSVRAFLARRVVGP